MKHHHLLPFAFFLAVTACQDQLTSPTLPLEAGKGGPKPPPSCTGVPRGTTSIAIAPAHTDLQFGTTVTLLASNQSGVPVPACALVWSSGSPQVASVIADGTVSGVALGGPVTITAQTTGKKPLVATASVTVVDLIVATLEVTPATSSLEPSGTASLTAVARNRFGDVLSGKPVTWSSGDLTVATVSSSGMVSAIAAGDASITALSEGVTALATVRVSGWRKLADAPTTVVWPAMTTFDPLGRRLFVAMQYDYSAGSPDIWRFDLATTTWTPISDASAPSGKYRQYQFDASSGGRILTFWDGLGSVFSLPATGGSWSALGGANSEAYYEGASFIDPVTGRLSLLMGYGLGTHKNTFWQFDGAGWLLRPTTNTPIARMGPRVAPDPAGERVFLLGGHLTVSNNPTDVWSLDLNTLAWTNIMPNGLGPQAGAPWAGYVPGLDRVYVYGGDIVINGAITGQFSSQLSYVDVATGTLVPVTTAGANPGGRRSYLADQMHYDAPARRLILAAGLSQSGQWQGDVWAYYLP